MNNTIQVLLSLNKGLDIIKFKGIETTISNKLLVTYYDGSEEQLEGEVLNLKHIAKIALLMGANINTKIKYEIITRNDSNG